MLQRKENLKSQKKIRLETKYIVEMKTFLLSKGLNGKRFGRMSNQTMDKHVEDFKFKESKNDKDTDFVKDFEEAMTKSKQTQQPEQQQEQQPESQQ